MVLDLEMSSRQKGNREEEGEEEKKRTERKKTTNGEMGRDEEHTRPMKRRQIPVAMGIEAAREVERMGLRQRTREERRVQMAARKYATE